MATEPKAVRKMTRLHQLKLKNAPSARVDSNAIAAVPLTIQAVVGQTGDLLQITDSSGVVLAKVNAAGQLVLTAEMSLASPFGLGAKLCVARAKYDFAVDGGAIGAITPAATAVIPDNAVIVAATINPTTAVTSAGSATVAVGTTAGSSASALLAATAKASLSLDALINGVPVFATPVKMTAAGSINVTVATAALTAGVIEITVFYFVAAN